MDVLKELNIEDIITSSPNDEEEVVNRIPLIMPDKSNYKTVATQSLVTVIAYLLGVKMESIENNYGAYNQRIIDELKKDKDSTVIRYLCRLRKSMMLTFKKTDYEMRNNLMNIDRLEWFEKDEIKQLQNWGIQVVKVNYTSAKYIEDINGYINENIDKCKKLFPEWLNWKYIKEIFVIPKSKKKNVIYKEEFEKYIANQNLYPFKTYMYWTPEEAGNILSCDEKFLSIIYAQHGDNFTDRSKFRDASDNTKENIYKFIDNANKVQLFVDCENSDAFKLFSALKSLDSNEVSKIEKIVLYDDEHTTEAWDYLHRFTDIPVEHVMVDRVNERKSLVDLRLTAGVCQSYYQTNTDSFILCSSDSDFWGVITALPAANFLVMFEYSKCGKDIKEALSLKSIFHCSLDDFYSGETGKLKKVVLRKSLEEAIENGIIGMNGYELTKSLFEKNHIEAKDTEITHFYEKYVRTLRLKLDETGCFYIDIVE